MATLLLDFYDLAIVQVLRTFGDHGVTDGEAGYDFCVGTATAAKGYSATLDVIVLYEKHDFLAAVVTDGALGNERSRRNILSTGFFLRLCAEKGDLDAHVRQNVGIEFQERDAYLYGGLLAVSRRDDCADLTR